MLLFFSVLHRIWGGVCTKKSDTHTVRDNALPFDLSSVSPVNLHSTTSTAELPPLRILVVKQYIMSKHRRIHETALIESPYRSLLGMRPRELACNNRQVLFEHFPNESHECVILYWPCACGLVLAILGALPRSPLVMASVWV